MAGTIDKFDFDSIVLADDFVLVWYENARAEKTAGGIYIPQETQEKEIWQSKTGILVKAGANVKFGDKPIPMFSRVFYQYYAGEVMESTRGLTYRLMNFKDIRAYQPSEYSIDNNHLG